MTFDISLGSPLLQRALATVQQEDRPDRGMHSTIRCKLSDSWAMEQINNSRFRMYRVERGEKLECSPDKALPRIKKLIAALQAGAQGITQHEYFEDQKSGAFDWSEERIARCERSERAVISIWSEKVKYRVDYQESKNGKCTWLRMTHHVDNDDSIIEVMEIGQQLLYVSPLIAGDRPLVCSLARVVEQIEIKGLSKEQGDMIHDTLAILRHNSLIFHFRYMDGGRKARFRINRDRISFHQSAQEIELGLDNSNPDFLRIKWLCFYGADNQPNVEIDWSEVIEETDDNSEDDARPNHASSTKVRLLSEVPIRSSGRGDKTKS